ncbi:MAG: hypothetical protein ACPGSB_09575 [Opitutales bacterium]
MKRLLLLLPLICLCMPGCLLLSLHPYYEDDDIIEHDSFAGKWQSDDGKMLWEFLPTDDGYRVTVDESGKQGKFDVTPFKISGELFLDFYPDMTNSDEVLSPFYMMHRMPVHSLIHIAKDGDAPLFRIPDFKWFAEYLREHPDAIEHEWIDDGDFPLLSAGTQELQAFVMKHLNKEGAFNDLKLERVPME